MAEFCAVTSPGAQLIAKAVMTSRAGFPFNAIMVVAAGEAFCGSSPRKGMARAAPHFIAGAFSPRSALAPLSGDLIPASGHAFWGRCVPWRACRASLCGVFSLATDLRRQAFIAPVGPYRSPRPLFL